MEEKATPCPPHQRKGAAAREAAFRLVALVGGFVFSGVLVGVGVGYLTQTGPFSTFLEQQPPSQAAVLFVTCAAACGLACWSWAAWQTERARNRARTERFAEIRELIEQERQSFAAVEAMWKQKEKTWNEERLKWQQRFHAWCKQKETWRAQKEDLLKQIAALKEERTEREARKAEAEFRHNAEQAGLLALLKEKVEELQEALTQQAALQEHLKEEAQKWHREAAEAKKELEKRAAEEETSHLREQKEYSVFSSHGESSFKLLSKLSGALRSPIQRIAACARAKADSPQEALAEIASCADQFSETVDSVLELAKAHTASYQLVLSTVELQRLITRTIARLRPLADRRGIALLWHQQGQDIGVLSLDEGVVERAVVCVVRNAIQWTDRGGRVEIRARTEEKEGRTHAIVEVRDTGAGIPQEKLGEIFEPFTSSVQTRSMTAREGAGLGLALARALTRVHGGTISVESKPAEGSCFTLTFCERKAGSKAPGGKEPQAACAGQAP